MGLLCGAGEGGPWRGNHNLNILDSHEFSNPCFV